MRLTANQIFEIMAYDPITLKWKDEAVLSLGIRATIQGDLEGHPVIIYLSDEDFASADENGVMINPIDFEVGIFQLLVDKMHAHGILPSFRRKDPTAEAGTPEATKTIWACPTHGGQFVYKSNFGDWMNCTKYELNTGSSKPDWAKDKLAVVKGEQRWYCKYKEN